MRLGREKSGEVWPDLCAQPLVEPCNSCPPGNKLLFCKAVGCSFSLLPPLPPPPPKTLLCCLTLAPAAELLSWKPKVGTQSVSQMPLGCYGSLLAVMGASLFIKLHVIRCGRFKSPLQCLGTSPFLHLRANQSFCSLISKRRITKHSKGWVVLYVQQLQLSFYPKYVYIVFKSVWMRKF